MSLRKNTLWNLAGAGAPLLVAVFSIPYLLRSLGADGFGVLTLVWALIGYFSLFDFGVGRALTYELGRRPHASDAELAPYLRAGMALTLATGVAGGVLIAALAQSLSARWLNIGPTWKQDAFLAFLIAAVGIVPTTVTSGLRGAFEGLNQFHTSNLNRIALGALTFALPAWSVFFHGNHIWIATTYMVAARLAFTGLAAFQLRHVLFLRSRLERIHISSLMNYGIWLSITGIIGPLMIYGDRFFVSAAVGTEALAQYAIPQEGLQRLLLIPAALTGALLPKIAALSMEQVLPTYRRTFRQVALGMLGICGVAALLAHPVLTLWISPDFADASLGVTLMLCVGIWFNAIAMVPYTVIHAAGRPKITAIFHAAELLLYAALLWLLASHFGIFGAALAWTLRVVIDFILMYVAAQQILRNSTPICRPA